MDQLQEDKIQEDNNPNSGTSEDNTNDGKTSFIENQNVDSETLCSSENNNSDQKDVKPATITGGNNSPEKSEDNPENNNLMECVSESGKGQGEEGKLSGEVLMETEEKQQSEKKSSDDKELPKPPCLSPLGGLQKYCSDDDSVDSSSDSSSSSSSSSDESSSSDDEMDEDDNDKVGLPMKVVTVPPSVEKKEEPQENGKSKKTLNFPNYRDNDDESSDDTSSDSSSSSSSETEDNEADHTLQRPNRPPKEKDSDGEERISRPRVKGEIFPEELPALENLNINIDDNVDLRMLGKVTSVIRNIAVAHAEFSSPIDQDSMVFLKDRTCVGKVHDIIGPVREPFYMIILDKKHITIPLDTEIYCAPEEKEYTKYVFVNDLKNLKGSDASWEHDIEPPERFLDYSDDEQERAMKKRNKCKNSANANGDSNDDPNDKNGKSRNRNRPGPSSAGPTNTRNWRKRGQNSGPNSNTSSNAKDTSQKSMFACSTQWPPSSEQSSFSSWPPPTPPQYPQPNNPSYQEECNRLNQMIWPPNYQGPGPNSPADMRAPFRPSWNFSPRQPNMGPYPRPFNHPPSGNSFNPLPPNQPWFQGPQRLPHGSVASQRPPHGAHGPQRPQGSYGFMRNPPRFSQPPQFPGMFP